jgi:hypothetical protein
MGYYCDADWALAVGYTGLVWTATDGGTQNDISDYTISTSDRDDTFTITSGLPTLTELNNGIFLRVNGRDSDGGGEDDLWLDYLYFTIDYDIYEIVINEVMYDPTGGLYDDDWSYRKKITIDHNKVADDLNDFPVLISMTDSDLAADAQNDGDDILFTAADGETRLAHELEKFDGGTGELVAWVNVSVLSATYDTELYMYYGNSGASNMSNPGGVWDTNYSVVYHMNETGSGATDDFKDSLEQKCLQGWTVRSATGCALMVLTIISTCQ